MKLDRVTIARGAAFGLMIAVPAALASTVLSDQAERSQGLLALTYLLVVVGFAVAGFAGASLALDRRRAHGIAAAVAAWLPAQVIGVLGRLDRGDPLSVPAMAFLFAFALIAGNAGALVAIGRQAGRATS